jgi:hypothetical protein
MQKVPPSLSFSFLSALLLFGPPPAMSNTATTTTTTTGTSREDPEATYWARILRIYKMIKPDTVFAMPSDVALAKTIVFENAAPTDSMSEARAMELCSSYVHPQSKETIVHPLSVSWILPMNIVVGGGMVQASMTGSLPLIALSQVGNQTYNVLHYYANRNFTGEDNLSTVLASYVAAVSSSIGGAMAIEKFARTSQYKQAFRYFGPVTAVSLATFVNMGLMRQGEILEGVEVADKFGDVMGVSKTAGQTGIGICVGSRILTALVPMTVPTMVTEYAKKGFLKGSPRLHIPFYFATLAVTIQAWTPPSLGLCRQHTWLDVSGLESKFQGWKMRDGNIAEKAYFNRGM